VVSAFPAIVGPLLLIAATTHGPAFAARSAIGVLLGLFALSGFAVVYAWVSRSRGWIAALAAGWMVAAGLSFVASTFEPTMAAALVVAVASLTLATWALPRPPERPPGTPTRDLQVAARMGLAFALVTLLTLAADRFGAVVSGLLAALPVLASILVCSTHHQHGSAAATKFLQGMLTGLGSFVAFCAVIAELVTSIGTPAAFALALVCAVAAQGVALAASRPDLRVRLDHGRIRS
jgi:hypothetical protein